MAKLTLHADALMDLLLGRSHSVTVNNVTWDAVYRTVTFDVVGSDVPDVEEVVFHKMFIIECGSGKVLERYNMIKPKRKDNGQPTSE